jgi:hypothetical protein
MPLKLEEEEGVERRRRDKNDVSWSGQQGAGEGEGRGAQGKRQRHVCMLTPELYNVWFAMPLLSLLAITQCHSAE